nr:hypothetical protein [uncultured Roseateles sp.]
MRSICLLILLLFSQLAVADENTRLKLSAALIAGSPWSFSNRHVSETESWRRAQDGSLEYMSSYASGVWVKQVFEANDTLVRSSRAGGNTITYYLDSDGNAAATHSKNLSVFKSIQREQGNAVQATRQPDLPQKAASSP